MELQAANRESSICVPAKNDLTVILFTDPLCCWSWAFIPVMNQLREYYGSGLHVQNCMAGLLPDWNHFQDDINSVHKAVQMGPLWMYVKHMTGVELNSTVWMNDPPASSYPACIAVKCAYLQSESAGEEYLHLVREYVMLNGKNISRTEILIECAEKISTNNNFDVERFVDDLTNGKGIEAFRKDLELMKKFNIERTPSLVIMNEEKQTIVIPGYRDFGSIVAEVEKSLRPIIK